MSLRSFGVAAALVAAGAIMRPAGAQEGVQPEVRLDVIAPHPGDVQLGGGVEVPAGWYTRIGIIAAGGVARDAGTTTGSGRGDVLVRFLLDPFREARVGVSLGGGVSLRYDPTRGWREYVALVLDLEGQPRGGVLPALQVGLGGGARIGLSLRRVMNARR